MPKTFNGSIDFTSNFNVQTTRPLDNRLVVDSYSDLTNGSIEAPYQGMVVNIKGTSELWILLTSGIEASHQLKNWELVTGSGSGSGEGVEQRIKEIWYRLGLVESDIDDIRERLGDFLTSSDLEDYVKLEELPDFLVESDLDGYVKIEDLDDFLTSSDLDGYVKIEKLEDYIPKTELENLAKKSDLDGYVRFEDVTDFLTASDIPTNVSEFVNDVGYITANDLPDFLTDSDLDGYVKVEDLDGYLKPEDIADLVKKSDLDGYVRKEDALDFLTASDIPTKVSELINDAGYLTEKDIEDVKDGLGTLTEIVGAPGTGGDESTGIFEELDTLKKNVKGAALSNYILPVMTQDMVDAATEDSDVDFDGSEDPHILVEYNPLGTTPRTHNDIYMGLIRDMMGAIRSLQAEVARLKNTFDYGIDSYKNTRTAKSVTLGGMKDVDIDEPLWAIDPGYLSLVSDNPNFNTLLDINHSFITVGTGTIDTSVEGQLTFVDCKGRFQDGNVQGENPTLYLLKDSKLITYLVTDKPDIKMTLVSLDNKSITREIDFTDILGSNRVNKYGFCVVISRKVRVGEEEKGFNYIYFSIINYENDEKLFEGYLTDDNRLVPTRVDVPARFSIQSLDFDRLTLSRMKFYTKFEDFTEEVISSMPSEDDYKYEVAHIAIRSVKDTDMLNTVADHLRDNELVWNKAAGTLHIKSEGKMHLIGSNSDEHNKDENMTDREIIRTLERMGIVVNVEYKKDEYGDETDDIKSVSHISMAPISDVTFVNEETKKKFTFKVDTEGNLVGKDNSTETIDEFLKSLGTNAGNYDATNYKAVRGFVSDYLSRKNGTYTLNGGVNKDGDTGKQSDRLRISSFYAPITTDEAHGCTHSFIELENSSNVDIPLTGIYLHFYSPAENDYKGGVHHLALDGVIKAGGTYLIRGAKHAEFDDESAFIKVRTYDKEWYENGVPISFEQEPVKSVKETNEDGTTTEIPAADSNIKKAYRFCLTYGLPELSSSTKLVERNTNEAGVVIDGTTYKPDVYPNIIVNPRFIDSCSYSTLATVSNLTGNDNPWYANGDSAGIGITITKNSMFRLMFALDPAKQAYNGFNTKDGSRVRYNKATDLQVVNLDKEFIGYPHSNETVKIDRYTPKASFENRNVMTDKTQLNREKPNMVTCSFGVDVYNTRCFNWISCGTFDEYVWIRKEGETSWNKFQSYTKISSIIAEDHSKSIYRKEYAVDVNNTIYARIINRFPGNDVLFTSHKCVVVLPDAEDSPVEYEYVVGRPDKDGNPDPEHTNRIFTFTLYPRTYEGRTYQITDQQGFHWIEYQVWAASAEFLNTKIEQEITDWNSKNSNKVFPILINTGDMTQSGARINEWLDYYNGGVSLFDHLEQMNCVGNNDLCPINPRELGTGNDTDKSSSHFFHYFYCFDVRDNDVCTETTPDPEKPTQIVYEGDKFYTGESLIVKAHTGSVVIDGITTNIDIKEDRYIPSIYYFKTKDVMYVIMNSEIPYSNVQKWFGLCSKGQKYINIYTGIEVVADGNYAGNVDYFTPIYETIYAWLNNNNHKRKVIVAMHEMPFTVITKASLDNKSAKQVDQTRNYPLAKARLGSNVNQMDINETRGIFWCSRLLEYFNCKLVIGGHKHTYALSYPIKEKYSWAYTGESVITGIETNHTYDSAEKIKPMSVTLADEAGSSPKFNVSWDIDLTSDETRTEYNVTTDRTTIGDNKTLNSTKTPYIPKHLYDTYGKDVYNTGKSGIVRCCTPLEIIDNTDYDGFVTYSMCQATGYKLKSNKELPSQLQVFSKIIPMTNHKKSSDSPNANQLYPMYSVLEFNDDCSEVSVSMNRITGIFKKDGADKFTQIDYGTKKMGKETLCTFEKEDCKYIGIAADKPMIDVKADELFFATDEKKVYKCSIENGVVSWKPVYERMYGKWLSEADANTRYNNYVADPTNVADNRYLHIKF